MVTHDGWEWTYRGGGAWDLRAIVDGDVVYLGRVHETEVAFWWEVDTLATDEGRSETETEAKAAVVARARELVAALALAVAEDPNETKVGT